jgi:hypothetical protein
VITNVGIVDYTPKKELLCLDMLKQIKYVTEEQGAVHRLEEYRLSDGRTETLFNAAYSSSYISRMKAYVSSIPLISIKTPLIKPDIKIERPRPASFFSQLHKTNELIDSLGITSVELDNFDNGFTYDAVHWTARG